MIEPNDPIKDISEIRSIMERSTKVLSLSGIAGISIGILALCAVLAAQWIRKTVPHDELQRDIVMLALGVLFLSIGLSVYFSSRMARRKRLPVWNQTAKFLVTELAIPLAAGGIMCIALLVHEAYFLLPATMLAFYGLSLLNASKFTVKEVRYLGLTQIVLGLLAALFPEEGMNFWAAGFGVVHILYGLRIFLKYEK